MHPCIGQATSCHDLRLSSLARKMRKSGHKTGMMVSFDGVSFGGRISICCLRWSAWRMLRLRTRKELERERHATGW